MVAMVVSAIHQSLVPAAVDGDADADDDDEIELHDFVWPGLELFVAATIAAAAAEAAVHHAIQLTVFCRRSNVLGFSLS